MSDPEFQLKSAALRRFWIKHGRCPECGQFALDVGNECTRCGFDAMPESRHKTIPVRRAAKIISDWIMQEDGE